MTRRERERYLALIEEVLTVALNVSADEEFGDSQELAETLILTGVALLTTQMREDFLDRAERILRAVRTAESTARSSDIKRKKSRS